MKHAAELGLGALVLLLVYVVGFGIRVGVGLPAYAEAMLGPEAARTVDWGALLAEPILLGEASWTVPSLVTAACGAVLVAFTLVMLLVGVLVRTRSARLRWVTLVGSAAACTGSALLSIHPVLALPSVPEGPRMMLNYAFEAVGYGWVNVLAYAGPLLGAATIAWRSKVDLPPSAPPTGADANGSSSVTDADEATGAVAGE